MTNIEEAVKWLSYTYLFVRMRINPLVYGIPYNSLEVTVFSALWGCLWFGAGGLSAINIFKMRALPVSYTHLTLPTTAEV